MGTLEEVELDGKEFQQDQSCFAIGPKTDGLLSCRLGSLAFG